MVQDLAILEISDHIPKVLCSMMTITLLLLITETVINSWRFHYIAFALLGGMVS